MKTSTFYIQVSSKAEDIHLLMKPENNPKFKWQEALI